GSGTRQKKVATALSGRLDRLKARPTNLSVIRGDGRAARLARERRDAQFLVFVLELVEAVVNATAGQQLLVSALLAHPAFVEDEDLAGVLDGAQAMGDD